MAKVLAVGAHPDDVELGAGGTLARHVADGDSVSILVLGTGATSRPGGNGEQVQALRVQAWSSASILGANVSVLEYPDQRFDSVNMLDLVQSVEAVVTKIQPHYVYTHSQHDLNLDHQRTHSAVMTACRPLPGSSVRCLYSFEVPSSTGWGDTGFFPTCFVDVSGKPLKQKLDALAQYTGEMRQAPHPRSFDGVTALAKWRGMTAGLEAAEAFEVFREIR